MNLAKLHSESNFEIMLNKLENEGNEIAYGSTYSIQEVRKAIADGQPVYAELAGGRILEFVGENPDSLVIQKDNEFFTIEDKKLTKAWTGNAIIVTGQCETIKEILKEDLESPAEFVIFAPDRDTWALELQNKKDATKNRICQIKYFDSACLPTHPVIVIFYAPDEDQKNKNIRAMMKGAEIIILDHSDPVTEFLHELGHVYWETRLQQDEKDKFEELHKNLDFKNIPSIFFSKASYKDPEELFCTVYLWYCKGKLLAEGYEKILHSTYHVGYKCLLDIIDRVKKECDAKCVAEVNYKIMHKTWKKNERQLAFWINQITNNVKLKIGHRIIKAKIPLKEPKSIIFPIDLDHEMLSELHGRQWILVKSGICKNKILILKNGYVDISFMNINKSRAHLVKKRVSTKSGRMVYRWVRPIDIKYQSEPKIQVKDQEKQVEKKSIDHPIHSKEFKNWFGDWAKKKGSQVTNSIGEPSENYHMSHVIDKKGKPIKVYHGTATGGFTEFKLDKVNKSSLFGAGFYFTEDKEISKEYQEKGAGKKGTENIFEIKEVYLNIRKPFDIDNNKITLAEMGITSDDIWDIPGQYGLEGTVNNLKQITKNLKNKDLSSDYRQLLMNRREELAKEYKNKVDTPLKYDDFIRHFSYPNEINKRLRKAGYDGLTHVGGQNIGTRDHKVWVAFEPNQIKATTAKDFDLKSNNIYKAASQFIAQIRKKIFNK